MTLNEFMSKWALADVIPSGDKKKDAVMFKKAMVEIERDYRSIDPVVHLVNAKLLREAADTIETLLSQDEQMPTYAETIEEAERVLERLRRAVS